MLLVDQFKEVFWKKKMSRADLGDNNINASNHRS